MELKSKKGANRITSVFLVITMLFSLVVIPSIKVNAQADENSPIMFVIDTSASMLNEDKLEATKENAKGFIDAYKNREVGLVTFNSKGEKKVVSSLTTDYGTLKKEIDNLKADGDKNKLDRPLREAIQMAKDDVKSKKKYENCTVKVMTDVTEDADGNPSSIAKAVKHTERDFNFNLIDQSIMLVIDASGSMGNNNKMENAKKAARNFIDIVKDKDVEVGLVVFYDYNNIILESPLGKDMEGIKSKISNIQPTGNTPLGEAIEVAGEELIKHASSSIGKIIVFGDGDSNGQKDPVEMAKKYGQTKTNEKGSSLTITVDTIGIQLGEGAIRKFKDIAKNGNGSYHDVKDPNDLGEVAEGIGNNIDITAIKITTPLTNVEPGKTLQLNVEGTKKNGEKVDITKSSSGTVYTIEDINNVSISKDGLISIPVNAKEEIKFIIHAKNNGHEDVFQGVISKSDKNIIKDIKVTPLLVTMKPGDTQQLNVIATMGDGSRKDITNGSEGTKYKSRMELMATVDANGLVTVPKDAEEGTINISVENSEIKADVTIVIEKNKSNEIENIEVTPSVLTLKAGDTYQLKVSAIMGDGSKKDITNSNEGTKYISGLDTIAKVDENGLITIPTTAQEGNINIIVKYKEFTSKVALVVEKDKSKEIKSIEVTPSTATLKAGESQQLKVTAILNDGSKKDITNSSEGTEYISGLDALAVVDTNGLVTIPKNASSGNVNITVKNKDFMVKVNLTVKKDEANEMKSIEVTPSVLTLKAGETQQLTVKAIMGDGSKKDITNSSEGTEYISGLDAIATVDANGLITIPKNPSEGKINITVKNKSFVGKVSLTVEKDKANEIKSIEVTPSTVTLKPGETQQLTVKAVMGDGSKKDITNSSEGTKYISGLEGLATVDANGLVTISKEATEGNVNIIVQSKGFTTKAIITVPKDESKEIKSIEVTPSTLKLKAGETQQLTVKAIMGDGSKKDITNSSEGTKYISGLESVATVDENGLITIPKNPSEGNINITVKSKGFVEKVSLTVEKDQSKEIKGITVTPSTVTLKPGETQQLTVVAIMGDGSKNDITNSSEGTKYISGLESVATVDANGLVTISKDAVAGDVNITVQSKGFTIKAIITVPKDESKEVKSIEVTPSTLKLKAGETQQLTVKAIMGDESKKDITNSSEGTKYISGLEAIATVDENGLITIPKNPLEGNINIIVKSKGFVEKVSLTVEKDQSKEIKGITVTPSTVTLKPGETQQLTVTAIMGDGSKNDITNSSEGTKYISGLQSIATVDANGLVTISKDATEGNINITVQSKGFTTKATITVPRDESKEIKSIEVTPSTLKLKAGETQQLTVKAIMGDGSKKDITNSSEGTKYISGLEAIATIDENGLITILKDAPEGKINITVKNKGFVTKAELTVEKDKSKEIKGIEVTPAVVTLKAGETQQLIVKAIMGDGSKNDITNSSEGTKYISGLQSMATVDANGLITIPTTALEGTINITVQSKGFTSKVSLTIPKDESKEIKSIEVTPALLTLKAGETQQLIVMAKMGDGSKKDITNSSEGTKYISGLEAIATVDANGLITIPKNASEGNINITVKNKSFMFKVNLTVQKDKSNEINSLEVTPSPITLKPGETQQLKVMAIMGDGNKKDITNSSEGTQYISGLPALATVDANGLITVPVTAPEGTINITVKSKGFIVKASLTVQRDQSKEINKILVTPSTLSLNAGDTQQLTVTAIMGDGSRNDITKSSEGTEYISGSQSMATVDMNGLITIPKNASGGNVVITIKNKNIISKVNLTVQPNQANVIKSISATPSSLILKAGETQQLTVKTIMGDGSTNDITNGSEGTQYISGLTAIATVDANGLVTIPKNAPEGNINITIKYKGFMTKVNLTVEASKSNVIKSLQVTPSTIELMKGQTQQLKVIALMGDGNKKDITNSSEGTEYISGLSVIATVDENGLVTIPLSAPEGTINIIIRNGGVTQKVSLTVKKDLSKELKGISVTSQETKLKAGESQQLSVVAKMGDGSTEDVTDSSSGIKYISGLEVIAHVDENGLITVPMTAPEGTINITVIYKGYTIKYPITIIK